METTLHQQLKALYAGPDADTEVPVGNYRIDVVDEDRLIEVQHSGLASLRDKVRVLLKKHKVEIIKPLIARKRLIKLDRKDGEVVSRRWSPSRACPIDLFHELIFFTKVFPHRNLTLTVPLIEIEEIRYPHRRRNRRRGQFRIQDQTLLQKNGEDVYRDRADLCRFLPEDLPSRFGTRELAAGLGVDRWVAQRVAYCLRETGCCDMVGKAGNALQYRIRAGVRRTLNARRKLAQAS